MEMDENQKKCSSDYGLIQPLTIPPESKIPDPFHGNSTAEEYDQYFRLVRNSPDLANWSKACLGLYENHLRDLDMTSLDEADKYQILKGWINVFQVTLERWVQGYEIEEERR
ncbi:hypothetical protein [Salinithrix halophila]|uniref:Uncharacterized protein n=1 Tax=Salinithrix halophila TaxID=1485204 RepID=A0ABV8JBC0_9BACL